MDLNCGRLEGHVEFGRVVDGASSLFLCARCFRLATTKLSLGELENCEVGIRGREWREGEGRRRNLEETG